MAKRFVSIWFPYLLTDWHSIRQPAYRTASLVLKGSDHGKVMVTALNQVAKTNGITKGMTLADARAIFPDIVALDEAPELAQNILKKMAEWCIRFTPVAAPNPPDGLLLDVSGCTHLWGGDEAYVKEISHRFETMGYQTKIGLADTVGSAWAVARFTGTAAIIGNGDQTAALLALPPESLRIEVDTIERLYKLGLRQIGQFINIPRRALSRRFGTALLLRLQQALGEQEENVEGIIPLPVFQERFPCLDPLTTAPAIERVLEIILQKLCHILSNHQLGLRKAIFTGYCTDGQKTTIEIGTNRPSTNLPHLLKLFSISLAEIRPGPGIELFTLDAPVTEPFLPAQEKLWGAAAGLKDNRLAELLDNIGKKIGEDRIHRFVPAQHYWPERSFKKADSLEQEINQPWHVPRPRPIQLLAAPAPIEVTAPVPDYPPMSFRYNSELHTIRKADGPERIEQEWWLQQGQHRDYYTVEDENGNRYWLFRLGHYDIEKTYQWFLHGFFA